MFRQLVTVYTSNNGTLLMPQFFLFGNFSAAALIRVIYQDINSRYTEILPCLMPLILYLSIGPVELTILTLRRMSKNSCNSKVKRKLLLTNVALLTS